MDAKELKPCPFCGNADIQTGRGEIGHRPTFHTYCNGCEAGTQGHPTREASDEAWNRRVALAHSDAVQAPEAWMLQEPGQSKRWYTSGEAAMRHWVSKGASATPLYAAPVAAAAAPSTPTKISDVQLNEAIQAAERKLGIVWFVPDDSDTFAWRTTNTNERSKFARSLVDALQGAAQ
ncbi:Lar family restriction alleviation protein [Paraburkholderia tropica]|uniref:Lar family restriction alleviation protein n=1 Tax=Paraburkholderia tropica TaxID=92647 RepID=UPI002AB7AFCB|nr:Lar family restriction alleviation protein [Paraburkholderia tropica]